jgi:uncharacterized membrane protein YdjX (TVP38/TMEM64 family)
MSDDGRPEPARRPQAARGPEPARGPALGSILLLIALAALLVALGFWLAPHVTRERVEAWVRGAGAWGPVVLLSVQVAQILAAPVPGFFVPLLAGALYGPLWGPIITSVGTIIGSTAAYWIGHAAGRPLAERLMGRSALAKAHRLVRGKRWLALVPIFLVPFSPADAVCFMAGIVNVPWWSFSIAVLVGRLPRDAAVAAGVALGWSALRPGG